MIEIDYVTSFDVDLKNNLVVKFCTNENVKNCIECEHLDYCGYRKRKSFIIAVSIAILIEIVFVGILYIIIKIIK